MSDATLNSVTQDPDDFAVQIADQIKTFIVAVTEVSKVEEPEEAVPVLLLQISQLLLAGGRLGAYEDIVPDERYEPDLGAEPDADGLRERFAALLEPIDVYSEVFDPYEPRKAPVPLVSPTTWPTWSPTCATVWPTTKRTARPRPCGGGSSPTSPTGAPPHPPPCAPSSPSSPTSASTSPSRSWTAWTRTRRRPTTSWPRRRAG